MSTLSNLINKTTIAPTEFHNPRVSMLRIQVSIISGCIQLSMAESSNKNHTGRVPEGTKIYDHDAACFFGVSPIECHKIISNISDCITGKYVNQDKNEGERYKDSITLTHFKDGMASKLIVGPTKDQNGNLTGSARLIIIPPQNSKSKMAYYIFRPDELKMFVEFLKHGAYDLPFMSQFINGIFKSLKQGEFNLNNQNGGNNNQNNYNNNSYEQDNTNYGDFSDLNIGNPINTPPQNTQSYEPPKQTQPATNNAVSDPISLIDLENFKFDL